MPNHVHLVLVPADEAALRRALGEAHRRYTQAVNRRQGRVGLLWRGRFASCALDPWHVLAAGASRCRPQPKRAARGKRLIAAGVPGFPGRAIGDGEGSEPETVC
jgi:putative transposase